MKRKLLVTLVLVLLLATLSFATAAADVGDAMVYVGHGIPGVVVDVEVEGVGCALTEFEFGTITDKIPLAAGDYLIEVFPFVEGQECAGTSVLSNTLTFEAGESATVIAHLIPMTPTNGITLTKFVNDLSPIVPGKARLTVRHTAAAPAVDVTLNRGWGRGRPVGPMDARPITDLENPNEAGPLDIRPGAYQAKIYPAGGPDPVADPIKVVLKPFKSSIVYAVGDLTGGSFTVLTQVIEGLDKAKPPRPNPPMP
jgi:hypothetical protein